MRIQKAGKISAVDLLASNGHTRWQSGYMANARTLIGEEDGKPRRRGVGGVPCEHTPGSVNQNMGVMSVKVQECTVGPQKSPHVKHQ